MIGRTLLMAALLAAGSIPLRRRDQDQGRCDFFHPGRPGGSGRRRGIDSPSWSAPTPTPTPISRGRRMPARLPGASALVSNGLGFEGWADRLVQAAPLKGLHIVASDGVTPLPAVARGHERAIDPHCWRDRRHVPSEA